MKHLNFLSKSSSRSCGHRVTTLALTVGSPSAHRRGAMLRLLSVLVLVLTFGVGNVWADYTVTFKTSGSGEKTTMTDIVNSGGDYLSACTGSKTYTESNGLRFGTGSALGNVVCTMSSTGQVQASKITLKDVVRYNTDASVSVKTTITYTDDTKKEDTYTAPTSAADHDITLISTKTIKSVKIESLATSKRFHVKGFTVVTVAATPRTVSWKCNGLDWESGVVTGNTTVNSGSKISAVPTAPTSSNCDNTKEFVGWTTSENYSSANTAPTDLFTDVAGSPTISADITFYAVFATKTLGAETNASSTLTIKRSTTAPTSPYNASDGTIWTFSGLTFNNTNTAGIAASTNASIEMVLPNTATCATSIELVSAGNTWAGASNSYLTLTGSGVSGTIGTLNKDAMSYTFTASDKTANKDKAGTYTLTKGGSKGAWIASVTINYKKQTINYSNYATSCCTSLGSINGSFFWTTHFCPAWPAKHRS